MKYTIRKLLFLLVLGAMVATPFAYTEYKSLTTTDPFILMARDIRQFRKGGINVLTVQENPGLADGITTVLYIRDYPDWSVRQDHPNFNQHVLQAIAKYDYTGVVMAIGWDFPPDQFRVQGAWVCEELRRSSCTYESVPSIILKPEFIQWPKEGKP